MYFCFLNIMLGNKHKRGTLKFKQLKILARYEADKTGKKFINFHQFLEFEKGENLNNEQYGGNLNIDCQV